MRQRTLKTIAVNQTIRCLKIDKYDNIIKTFASELNLLGYSQNTITTYILTIENMLKKVKKEPKNIKEEDIKQYLLYLKRNKENSNKTISMKLNAIKTFLKTTDNHSTENIKLPKIEKSLPKVLSIEEVRQLINSAENKRDMLIIRLLYSTGIRVSELIKLKTNSIENGKMLIISGKGSKDRIIHIDQKTEAMSKEYIDDTKSKTYIIENKDKKPLTARTIQRIIEKYKNKAGINKAVTPHILRHSFATHLLQNKADIVVIKELLGHSNLTTTQIYTNISNEFREKSYNSAHPLANEEKTENKERKDF